MELANEARAVSAHSGFPGSEKAAWSTEPGHCVSFLDIGHFSEAYSQEKVSLHRLSAPGISDCENIQ